MSLGTAIGRWWAARLRRGGAASGTPAEDRLRLLFEQSPVGIAFLDLRGIIVECNGAFVGALGVERAAVVGGPFADLVSKEDRDDVVGQLSKLVLGTVRAARLEAARMPGGETREVSARIIAGRVEDAGEVTGLIVHVLDGTDHRNLEVQLAQSQKMQAIGQLAGGIAHDFNNQLTATLGFCDLLLARHGPGDPSFDDIMQIRGNARRASNLVRQLLAFSRKQKLEPVVLGVDEALADLNKMLGRLLGADIELRLEGGGAFVRVDPGQFDQVIINLAVNARDAMPGGGILTIRTSTSTIEREVRRGADLMKPGTYVVIEVADTGAGIPKEVIGNIFEPFFSTKEVGAGTGLGLSTVHGIVHQTGGFVFVDSAPGEGAVFSIYLPACCEDAFCGVPPSAVSAPRAADADTGGAGTILLVEDEEAVRAFAARALRNKGYRVLEASNGETALDVITARDHAIDLIVTDVVMPFMDGHTLVRLARQELGGVKVILVSGYADAGADGGHGNDPSVHFLAKPFSLADLAGKVKTVLAA